MVCGKFISSHHTIIGHQNFSSSLFSFIFFLSCFYSSFLSSSSSSSLLPFLCSGHTTEEREEIITILPSIIIIKLLIIIKQTCKIQIFDNQKLNKHLHIEKYNEMKQNS